MLTGMATGEIHAATNSLPLVPQRSKLMTTEVCCSILKSDFFDCNTDIFKEHNLISSS